MKIIDDIIAKTAQAWKDRPGEFFAWQIILAFLAVFVVARIFTA